MKIAVAIPCYKVRNHIQAVIDDIPDCVHTIYAVDDACPEKSGEWIEENINEHRLKVLQHTENQGVGGAMITAYKEALNDDMDIVVKIDGDGQMDPKLLPLFVQPIIDRKSDYTKGNRFYHLESLKSMPKMRLFGNAALSFITKASCGYWNIMDPTNGYTAIHCSVLKELPLDKTSKRFFFESDMLFRLNTIRAVVRDIPMDAVYADETSNLNIKSVLPEFMKENIWRSVKRYGYSYWLRDFNIATIYSVLGFAFILFGSLFGGYNWIQSILTGNETSTGTVILAALPIILGFQLIIAFLQYDMGNIPQEPLASQLPKGNREHNQS